MDRVYNLLTSRRHIDAFLRDVLTTFVAQIFMVGLALLTLVAIGRQLGSEGKGIFELTVLLPNMLSLLLSGGIFLANAYFAGTQQFDVATLTAHSVSFTILSTMIGAVLLVGLFRSGLLNALMGDVPTPILLLGSLLLPTRLLGNAFQGVLRGKQNITIINVAGLIRALIFFLLTLSTLFALKWGVTAIILNFLLSDIAQIVLLSYFLAQSGGSFRPQWRLKVMKRVLGFGLRGQIGNILQFYNYRFDVFVVNFFVGASGVGIYNVAVQFAELLWFLPHAIGYAILPKAATSTKDTMNRFTPRVFAITLGVSVVAAMILAFSGRPLILFLFGQDFSTAYYPLLALLPGVVLLGSGKVLTNEIVGRGYPQYHTLPAGIALIATILLDFALIPRMGLVGAALASTCAYALAWLVTTTLYLRISR